MKPHHSPPSGVLDLDVCRRGASRFTNHAIGTLIGPSGPYKATSSLPTSSLAHLFSSTFLSSSPKRPPIPRRSSGALQEEDCETFSVIVCCFASGQVRMSEGTIMKLDCCNLAKSVLFAPGIMDSEPLRASLRPSAFRPPGQDTVLSKLLDRGNVDCSVTKSCGSF